MEAFYEINVHFIQFGTGLAVLLALAELYRNDEGRFSILFFLALCLASLQLRLGFYAGRQIDLLPGLTILFYPAMLAIGPLLVALVKRLVGFDRPRMFFLHFIPAGLAFFHDIYFNLLPMAEQKQLIQGALYNSELNLVNLLLATGMIWLTGYFCYAFYIYVQVKNRYKIDYSPKFWFVVSLASIGHITSGSSFFLQSAFLFNLGADFYTILLAVVFLILIKEPHFFSDVSREISQQRYAKTQLTSVDVEAVKNRLADLFESSKIYRDENLRIQQLADLLRVNKNQLSRILNESFQKSFYEFVNEHRIKEACEILASEQNKNIASIAFEVGFNSVSAFNAQFARIVKTSPAKYRQGNL